MRRPFCIFDLLLITLVVAAHLAHLSLAVEHVFSSIVILVPIVPTLIAVWIQLRIGLKTMRATCVHYLVCVGWAFLYGYGYSIALNARQSSFPTHNRMVDPLAWAFDHMRAMAVLALATSAVYALVSWLITRRAVSQGKARESRRSVE